MSSKFAGLSINNAPGQQSGDLSYKKSLDQYTQEVKGLDFSHGDVDAFPPLSSILEVYIKGVNKGGSQAYTEYLGKRSIRVNLCKKLCDFTGSIDLSPEQMIITPGTQGALFLTLASLLDKGDTVAIVTPDYFANRKISEFLEANIVNVPMDFLNVKEGTGIDFDNLEKFFSMGVKVFLFSNPNNPTGIVYTFDEILKIGELASKYGVIVVVDQLYSRQIFDKRDYTHMCGFKRSQKNLITIMGPSKTESLSGYRVGVAFGDKEIISRMEKLQAIVSLRASGYNQAVLNVWFNEPSVWLENRIEEHQKIRDELYQLFTDVKGVRARLTEGGSYLFITVDDLSISMKDFVNTLRMNENIVVTVGTEFGKEMRNSFRINFSQDRDEAVIAVKTICKYIRRFQSENH